MQWPQFPTKVRVALNSDNRVGVILNSFNQVGVIRRRSGAAWGPAQRGKRSEGSASSFEGLQPLRDVLNVPKSTRFS